MEEFKVVFEKLIQEFTQTGDITKAIKFLSEQEIYIDGISAVRLYNDLKTADEHIISVVAHVVVFGKNFTTAQKTMYRRR